MSAPIASATAPTCSILVTKPNRGPLAVERSGPGDALNASIIIYRWAAGRNQSCLAFLRVRRLARGLTEAISSGQPSRRHLYLADTRYGVEIPRQSSHRSLKTLHLLLC